MRVVDLRSDTVTQPTPEMRRAMFEAEVGDDVWDEDPTVHQLEDMAARITGKEAAVFTPSGTMSNLMAVLAWTKRGDEIILGNESHIFWNEVGSASALGGVVMRTVPNDASGRLDPADVEEAVRGPNIHFPPTTLVCLENTHNRCGGGVLTVEETAAVAKVAHDRDIPVHLDGARIFNASVALGLPPQALTEDVDSVCFCISKGLSAPVGSLLCGSEEFIARSRKWRKMLGGGMRQAGVLAAAGVVAMDSMIERLADDHVNAKRLAEGLAEVPGVSLDPDAAPTNILVLEWTGGPAPAFMERLAEQGVKASYLGGSKVRMVTHAGISPGDVDYAVETTARVAKEALAVAG